MCKSLWLYEINRRKWTWQFIMKIEWRLGLLLSPSSAKAPWCPRETGEREKKKACWGLWEENIIANFIGIPSGSLDMRRSGASVQKPMTWSVNLPWNPGRQTLPVSFYLKTLKFPRTLYSVQSEQSYCITSHAVTHKCKKIPVSNAGPVICCNVLSALFLGLSRQYIYWLFISVLTPIVFYSFFSFPSYVAYLSRLLFCKAFRLILKTKKHFNKFAQPFR